jgi:hypothetical protein
MVEDVAHRRVARVRGVDEHQARAEAVRKRAHFCAPVCAVWQAQDVDRACNAECVCVRARVRSGAVQSRPCSERMQVGVKVHERAEAGKDKEE